MATSFDSVAREYIGIMNRMIQLSFETLHCLLDKSINVKKIMVLFDEMCTFYGSNNRRNFLHAVIGSYYEDEVEKLWPKFDQLTREVEHQVVDVKYAIETVVDYIEHGEFTNALDEIEKLRSDYNNDKIMKFNDELTQSNMFILVDQKSVGFVCDENGQANANCKNNEDKPNIYEFENEPNVIGTKLIDENEKLSNELNYTVDDIMYDLSYNAVEIEVKIINDEKTNVLIKSIEIVSDVNSIDIGHVDDICKENVVSNVFENGYFVQNVLSYDEHEVFDVDDVHFTRFGQSQRIQCRSVMKCQMNLAIVDMNCCCWCKASMLKVPFDRGKCKCLINMDCFDGL